ncbi:MAG TPA: PilZ domain-containing protein [Polyangia bacterium]|nr:PilZ domain-containing protein [Polyangia bacterium]
MTTPRRPAAGPPRVPRADRIEINHEFRSVDEFIHEYVTNVSRSGVFIRSKDPLAVGTRVALKFSIIMEDIETVEGIGEVVRVSRHPRGMGVVFTNLTDHSMDLLAKLLTRRGARGRNG